MVRKEPINEIYNPYFDLDKEQEQNFPDGWLKVGGGPKTTWEWIQNPDGSKEVKIVNPYSLKAGIRQEPMVFVTVGEQQRWLAGIIFQTDTMGCHVYIKIFFSSPEGRRTGSLELNYRANEGQNEYRDAVAIPNGSSSALIEVGLSEAGVLSISRIYFGRLYPVHRVRLDEKGQLFVRRVDAVREIIKPIRLQGPIEVDIRNLEYWRDSVRIYGSQLGIPLKTSPEGKAQVEVTGYDFTESKETLSTGDEWNIHTGWDVSKWKVYSLVALNTGANAAQINTLISPDAEHWLWEETVFTLEPGAMQILIPSYFLRFLSLGYCSAMPGAPTELVVWCQAQS